MSIEPWAIIQEYIDPHSYTFSVYAVHVVLVANLALRIARQLELSKVDQQFIAEATLLHDIGMVKTKDVELGCSGSLPYLCHGVEGAKILIAVGLPQHARVAERHTGVGIAAVEIAKHNLPLPPRDLVPETLPEKIIAYADKFFTKTPDKLWTPYTVVEIEDNLRQFGEEKVAVFRQWQTDFQLTANDR